MGYITSYRLQVIEGDPDLIRQFVDECENANYAIDADGNAQESCKWYKSEEDMKAFSKKHPEALFRLDGEGEDSDDLWQQYWRNGKCQNIPAEITYAPFDETKMV